MPEQLNVAEIQREAERLLGAFHDFCEAQGLRYFAAYGTLLGAVRHQGPIPWDDDVDLLMPRPDYDRFISLYRAEGSEHAAQHDAKIFAPGDADFPIHFVKYVSTRTQMVESGVHFPQDYGVFIDVFPLDGLPQRLPGLHLRRLDFMHRLFQAAYHQKLPEGPLPMQVRLRRMIGTVGRIVPRSTYLSILERGMRRYSYDSAEQVAMLLSCLPLATEAFSKHELEGETWLSYGNLTIRGFANPEAVLERNYGPNWCTPIKREAASHGIATWRER